MSLNQDQRNFEAQLTMWVLQENRRSGPVELALLEEKAKLLAPILAPELDDLEVAQVVVAVSNKGHVSQEPDFGIVDSTFQEWIAERKASTEEARWNAYRGLLVARRWAPAVIEALDAQTDAVVELMGDPTRSAPWARRGLLMGEVQSGKTATYLGVLNKAIDYGYRVIVILGGHTNDLRAQTQARVDHDLTGTNSSYLEDNISAAGSQMRIGIGLVDQTFTTIGMTTVRRDFSASSKLASTVWVTTGAPTVFVIKKNVRMLENVRNYIAAQGGPQGFDLPLVVVDDEADWGSPNTNDPDSDPTRVNKAIRRLLDVSKRSTYLGITATPFANVLIDHSVEDDLFPSDYIRALGAPSDYLGAGQYFDASGADAVITDVDDCLAVLPLKHKKEHPLEELPASLEDAIIAFFVGTAIRRLRDDEVRPASMMINVSRFNLVQGKVSALTGAFVRDLASVIATELQRRVADRSPLAERIRNVCGDVYPDEPNLDVLVPTLAAIADEVRVELVNNQTAAERANVRRQMSAAQREAHDLRPVIYVGGDVLSRGITLDGLQVSYFVRQPGSADTLLQMGRWFGYRQGYEDLVRIWMPSKTEEIFTNVARISQELREDLREMEAQRLTPKQFGLKIRLVPEIAIVAANKRRAAEVVAVTVSLHGQIRQSVDLSAAPEDRKRNAKAVQNLVTAAELNGSRYQSGQPHSWAGVPLHTVSSFFDKFHGHHVDPFFGSTGDGRAPQIARFLAEAKNADNWDVVIVGGGGGMVHLPGLDDFPASRRNKMEVSAAESRLHFKNQQIASPADLAGALPIEERKAIELALDDGVELTEGELRRRHINRPMLMIYAVTHNTKEPYIDETDPLWAVRVVFPSLNPREEQDWISRGGGVKILVNTVWQEQFFGYDPDPAPFDEEIDG